ncbi:MAG: transglycosylase domain-containing protein [Hyphomicrobiales bacterium]
MSGLKPPNAITRLFWRLDSWANAAVYEAGAGLRRGWAAYSSWLEHFRVRGLVRVVLDLADDAATFGLVFALGLLVFALPPFSGTGDIWNRGRQHAVTFTDTNGEIIGRRGIRQDDAIPLEEIPPHVLMAVLATEDARFYQHFGVDIQGTARAALRNANADGVVQGGSSITQQLAKNLFLTPERSMRRKINEAFLAMWIEARLSKDEILKMYLDRSYLGGGTYGVEAAAQFYFGKSIRDVTLAEAAMLAGLFKAPSRFAPHVNIQAARARANVVLYRMLDVGYITQGELFSARRRPAEVVDVPSLYSPDYFLDWAYRETLQLLDQHGLEGEYVLEVKTTLDIETHQAAHRILNEMLEEEGPQVDASQAALVAMEPDGALKAIIGGRDYEDSQFNRATEARRQPGSAFKPFVYLAALRNGFEPNSIVNDTAVWIGNWSPQNYNRRYSGRTTLTNALARSINTIPVHLMRAIGRKPIIDTAHLVGIESEMLSVPSLPLGTNEVTLMEMTSGYATFANSGRLAKPHSVLEIRRPSGDVIYARERNAPRPRQVVPESTIADLNYMMNQVVVNGTGRRAQLGFTPQAGKTGTTQDHRDAWFIGYTAHLVTGVWFGNDDSSGMKKVTGGSLPAMTWQRFMTEALDTEVAAPLAGVPLDDSYARDVAEREGGLDVRLTQSNEPAAGLPAEEEVVITRSPPQSDGVAGMFENIFGNRSQSQVRSSAQRRQREDRNERRLRNLLETR